MYRQRYEIHIPSDELTVTINKPRLKTALIKAARIALGIIITVSMLAMLGTAGALDCEAISFGQAVLRSGIALAVFGVSAFGIKIMEVLDN